MRLKLSSLDDAAPLCRYYCDNRTHLEPWEPSRNNAFYTVDSWRKRLAVRKAEQHQGRAAYFVAYEDHSDQVIATCSLTNICGGAFQAGYLGYSIDQHHQGQGKMKIICEKVIDYAFSELALNRVMANYVPDNRRSEKLLQSLGFVREGYARRYLKINGVWRDHVLTARLNDQPGSELVTQSD